VTGTADALIAAAEAAADELQTLAAANADLSAQNALLRAQLEAMTGTRTQFGINLSTLSPETKTWQQLVTDHRGLYGGPLTHIRLFSAGYPMLWSNDRVKPLTGADIPVFSFKQISRASFDTWMSGIPADWPEVWACFWHEVEADAQKSTDRAAFMTRYLGAYDLMDEARKAHPNGHKVKLVKILLWYSQVMDPATKGNWQDFHAGQKFVDALGMDCYSYQAWLSKDRYATAEELLGPLAAIGQQSGLPVCVPELGGTLAATDTDGSRRAAAIQSWVDYARDHGFLWANWWCAQGGAGRNHHLDAYPSNVTVWRDAMSNR